MDLTSDLIVDLKSDLTSDLKSDLFKYTCFCCSKEHTENPWMIVKNHNEGEKDYNICSYTCSQHFTRYYGNGYWNDILNKEDFSEPRPIYLKNTTYERKDITSGFDVEQIREEIMNEEIMNEEYERGMLDYTSSSEEDNYSEENY